MGDYSCNSCDKTIKLKHKRKQLNTKSHMYLSESIINKYCVKSPQLIVLEKIIEKHVNIYSKKFEFDRIICQWKLQFVDAIFMINLRE